MKRIFKSMMMIVLSVITVVVCVISQPGVTAFADTYLATYRNGAQSGPSTSYKNGKYYSHYTRIPITGDNRTDLIAIALSQLGYEEGNSDGSFSGESGGSSNYVEFSYNMGDLGIGYGGSDYPWCASFVSWCLYQSRCTDQATYSSLGRFHQNDSAYIWKEISCSQWVNQLKSAGYFKYSAYKGGSYVPQSGDLVYFQSGDSPSHIGICLYVKDGYIYTVEGNTSDASGLETNGGGVYFKNYSLTSSYLYGYGVLPYKTDSSVTKIDYSGTNPTPGIYISNSAKYIYSTETATSYDIVMPRFTLFEVTGICSNGRLQIKTENGYGYINNNTDRVIQLSSTANNDPTADERTELNKQINEAKAARHYNYTESAILDIRKAYQKAENALADTSKTTETETKLQNAITELQNALNNTGTNTIAQNNKGIYINARNKSLENGDCVLFTNNYKGTGLITVSNANIRYSVNVVFGWDHDLSLYVVRSVSTGDGSSTPDIQLGDNEFLIAAHDWETGVSESSGPVEYSATNYNILKNLKVGDAIKLSGVPSYKDGTENTTTEVPPCSYAKFIDSDSVWMTGLNTYVEEGKFVLFTPDFNGGVITPDNANIHNTLSIVAKWDNTNNAWVVANKYLGKGVADKSANITITDGSIVISGLAASNVADNEDGTWENFEKLMAANIGDEVVFSGISPTESEYVSVSANISFSETDNSVATPIFMTGLNKASDGNWYYYANGKVDSTYTGLAKNAYGVYYVKNGKLDATYTGMVKNAYGVWYVNKGKLDATYTGMVKNAYGVWYVNKGKLDTTFTGLCVYGGKCIYVNEGKFDTTFTGLAKNASGVWYMKNGVLDLTYTGMAKNAYGLWYVKEGKLDTTFTGLYVYGGKCIYVNKGLFDTTFTGLVKNASGIWYMKNGVLDLTYTGMAKNAYGLWYVKEGKLDTSFTGLYVYGGKCIYVNKGKFDTTYTGVAKNASGAWYIKNGVFDLTYNGKVVYEGKTYTVVNGKVNM